MSVQPHGYGAFSHRHSKNVFTLQDLRSSHTSYDVPQSETPPLVSKPITVTSVWEIPRWVSVCFTIVQILVISAWAVVLALSVSTASEIVLVAGLAVIALALSLHYLANTIISRRCQIIIQNQNT